MDYAESIIMMIIIKYIKCMKDRLLMIKSMDMEDQFKEKEIIINTIMMNNKTTKVAIY